PIKPTNRPGEVTVPTSTLAPAPGTASAPLRVRCRPELRLSPEPEGHRVIVHDEARDRQFRMSATAARMLSLLDGTRTGAQVAAELGVDGTEVEAAVARLVALDL